jgi:hypothetical protein
VHVIKHHSAKTCEISKMYVVCLKKFGEWYQKTNKTEDTNKLTLLAFKIIAILHNTLLGTFINLLETVSKGLFGNRSQNLCNMFSDCRHVCKTCAFYNALQAGKQKKVHPPYSPDLAPAGARSGEYSGLLLFVFWYHSPNFLDTPRSHCNTSYSKAVGPHI